MFKPNKHWIFGIFIICTLGFIYAQNQSIKGIVSDGNNSISFTKVKIKATNNSSITDYEGNFILDEIACEDSVVVAGWLLGWCCLGQADKLHALISNPYKIKCMVCSLIVVE